MSLTKQLTTVSEFEGWQSYFEERLESHDKSDYYQAAVIRAIFASQGARVSSRVSDYLLEFQSPKEPNTESTSKDIWLSIFGMESE